MTEAIGGIVYLRTTDKRGFSAVTEHRCWDADLFVKTTHAAAVKSGGRVEQLTEADYRKIVGKTRHPRGR